MNNKEFSKLLEKRTRDFGVRIIRLSASLPNTPEGREIRKQITKSEREARPILEVKLGFVRARQAKLTTG